MGKLKFDNHTRTNLHNSTRKTFLRTRITRQAMDFKSTIFIFGVALIFILPLVISSPISGGGKRAPRLPKATTEKTEPTKLPGSKRDVGQRGKRTDEYKGGRGNEWHIHAVGSNPHIKLGDTPYKLVQNQPEKNKQIARDALHHLDEHRPRPHNYDRLRAEIVKITQTGYI